MGNKAAPGSTAVVRSRCVEFVEWVNSRDIYMVNAGYWVKNNPEFGDHFAENTKELYIMFKEEKGT